MFQVIITYDLRRGFASRTVKPADSALGTAEVRRRFWAKVRVPDSDTACWPWTGSLKGGRVGRQYGQFAWAARYGTSIPVGAHRASWELTVGPIPAGQHVLHSCDNPVCVNPNHLFLGTHADNMRDAAQKGRLHVSRPRRQKVTDAQVVAIVAAARAGAKQCDLAAAYGVTESAISHFLTGKRRPVMHVQSGSLRRVG